MVCIDLLASIGSARISRQGEGRTLSGSTPKQPFTRTGSCKCQTMEVPNDGSAKRKDECRVSSIRHPVLRFLDYNESQLNLTESYSVFRRRTDARGQLAHPESST